MSDKPKVIWQDLPEIGDTYGATLRDQFAMAALTGLLAYPKKTTDDAFSYCEAAYELADAMLKARGE